MPLLNEDLSKLLSSFLSGSLSLPAYREAMMRVRVENLESLKPRDKNFLYDFETRYAQLKSQAINDFQFKELLTYAAVDEPASTMSEGDVWLYLDRQEEHVEVTTCVVAVSASRTAPTTLQSVRNGRSARPIRSGPSSSKKVSAGCMSCAFSATSIRAGARPRSKSVPIVKMPRSTLIQMPQRRDSFRQNVASIARPNCARGSEPMYDYMTERKVVFTEAGIKMLLAIRDRAKKLLEDAGAFREQEVISGIGGDSWSMLACVDYLVERGELRRIYDLGARQHNVYVGNSQ